MIKHAYNVFAISWHTNKVPYIVALLILLFQLGFQLHLAARDSQTSDEAVHLAAGLTYWQTGEFRFNPEHPPLVKLLAGLPLTNSEFNQAPNYDLLWDRSSNFFYDSWRENRWYGGELLYESNNDADHMLFLARIGPVLLTTLLGVTIFMLGTALFGSWAGLVALVLYTLDPTVAAHGHLVTTDIGASLGILGTVGALYYFLSHKSWGTAILLGLALGVALVMKFTTIMLVPLIVVFVLYDLIKNRPGIKTTFSTIGRLVVAAIFAWLVILVVYSAQLKTPPVTPSVTGTTIEVNAEDGKTSGNVNPTVDTVYTSIRPFLIPRDYFKGLSLVLTHTGGGHASILFGQFSNTGWWYYFPVVALMKTPILVLVLFAAFAVWSFKGKTPEASRARFFGFAALAILLFAMTSKANLGVRHILPIFPLLYVGIGAMLVQYYARYKTWILGGLALLVIGFALTYPHYLAYINPLFGGSDNGRTLVSDSSVDWGQDLKDIKKYVEENNITNAYIMYDWAGESALEYYGIERRSLHELEENKTGLVIISSSAIQDARNRWIEEQGQLLDTITPSVLVYQL